MRAVVLDGPGPPEALSIRELPVPTPEQGWVLIEVKAFGLNSCGGTKAACGPVDRASLLTANARHALAKPRLAAPVKYYRPHKVRSFAGTRCSGSYRTPRQGAPSRITSARVTARLAINVVATVCPPGRLFVPWMPAARSSC